MSVEQKRAWVLLVTAVLGYGVYLVLMLSAARDRSLPEVDYAVPLLGTIGGSIVLSIVASIIWGIFSPRGDHRVDERDREIGRYGDLGGQAFVIIGALAALLLALLEVPHFWIANAVYLAFVLSAVLGSVLRLTAYRFGMPR